MNQAFVSVTLVPMRGPGDTRFEETMDEFELRTGRHSAPALMGGRTYLVSEADRDAAFNDHFAPVLVLIDPDQAEYIGLYVGR